LGAGLTMLLAILVFFLPSPALNLFSFSRRAQFYGFSSMILIILGIFSAAFMDFSYVPIFLWAILFVFLGSFLSNPVIVFICAIMVPILPLGALINIIKTGNGRLAALYVSSNWNSPENWLAAFQAASLSLPLFLLVRRGTILFQKSKRRIHALGHTKKTRFIVLPVLIAAVLGAMVIQIRLMPRQQVAPERRSIAGEAVNKKGNEILKLSLDNVIFQDSRIITLRLGARGSPKRFDVFLESGNNLGLLPVYSAPVPFEREEEGRRIDFTLGENPPNPLVLEIVVPKDFSGILTTTALYNAWDSAIDSEKPSTDDYVLKVSRTVDLGSRK